MAVPRRSADPTRESLGRELQAIHEAKARYVTGSDPDSLAVRSSIEEREASLLGELTRREARIYAQTGVTLKPSEIFVEETPDSWVDRMVDAVYVGAYPDLPFEYGEFPETLTADGIVTLLRGVFQEHPGAEAVVSRLGPALRMTSPEAPHIFDVAAYPLMDVIGDTLESHGGGMPAQDLLGTLCRGHGLNRGLATMYLLAFVHYTHAEVKLNQGHEVRLRQGGRFPGDRAGWDTVTDIEYTVQLKDQLGTLRARPPVKWNTALPYATLLVDGLRPATDDGQIEEQDRLLLDALARLGDRIERHREAVGRARGRLRAECPRPWPQRCTAFKD